MQVAMGRHNRVADEGSPENKGDADEGSPEIKNGAGIAIDLGRFGRKAKKAVGGDDTVGVRVPWDHAPSCILGA